jgi:hypothetical protein
VEFKEGYLPIEQLSTIFPSDESKWDDFIRINTVSKKECDINGKPFKTLSEAELKALANYAWTNCRDVQGIVNYYFEIGTKKVGFGSRTWRDFMECVKDGKESVFI